MSLTYCWLPFYVIMIYPYLNQLAISFNQGMDSMLGGITIFPRKFTWENYRTVFTNVNFFNAVLVSVTRVIISVVLSILVVFSIFPICYRLFL